MADTTARGMHIVNAMWDNRDQIAVEPDGVETPEVPDQPGGPDATRRERLRYRIANQLCRSIHAQKASKSRAPDCSAIERNVPVSIRSCIGTLTTRTSSSLVGCSYRSLTDCPSG
jgi:hypothetical protein